MSVIHGYDAIYNKLSVDTIEEIESEMVASYYGNETTNRTSYFYDKPLLPQMFTMEQFESNINKSEIKRKTKKC